MKRLLFILLFIFLFVINANSAGLLAVTSPTPTGGDVTPPTLSTATIGTNGTTWTFVFDETVSIGAGGNGGWAVSMSTQGAVTLTYSSGSGSNTLVYTGNKTVLSGETVTAGLDYTQPGNGIEDLAGNDLVNIDDKAVTNNSTQGSYLFTETFENVTNYDNAPYSTLTSGGTLNPNYQVVALEGSESLLITYATAWTGVTWNITETDPLYFYFRFRTDTVATYHNLMAGQLTNDGDGVFLVGVSDAGHLNGEIVGGYPDEGTLALSANTTYHVWGTYTSGASATLNLRISTDGVKPGSDDLNAVANNSNKVANIQMMRTAVIGSSIVDKVRISTTDNIGNNGD